jgi:predicted metallopeptidase
LKINQQLDDSFIDDPQYVLDLVAKFQELLNSMKKRVRIAVDEKVEIAEN